MSKGKITFCKTPDGRSAMTEHEAKEWCGPAATGYSEGYPGWREPTTSSHRRR